MTKSARVAVLACIGSIYFVSFFQRVAVPGTVFDELQSAFRLTATGVAALGTIYLYLYGLLQPAAGMLADSWGAGRTVLASGLLLSAGSLLFPFATTIPVLYGSRALIGVGGAMIFVSLTKEVDELFGEKHFPFYLGVGIVLGYSGGLFGTYPFERLVRWQGWRAALGAMGVFCAMCWIGAAALLSRQGRLRALPEQRMGGWLGVVLRNRPFYPLMAASALNFSVYFLLQATLGKKLLQDFCGVSSRLAAGFTFTMMLVCIVAMFLCGTLASRLTRRRPFILGACALSLLAASGLALGIWARLPGDYFLACYILLALSSGCSPIFSTCAKELNPRPAAGTAIGINNAVAYLTVALVTSAAGLLLDAFVPAPAGAGGRVLYPPAAYGAVLAMCVLLSAASLVVARRVPESGTARD